MCMLGISARYQLPKKEKVFIISNFPCFHSDFKPDTAVWTIFGEAGAIRTNRQTVRTKMLFQDQNSQASPSTNHWHDT